MTSFEQFISEHADEITALQPDAEPRRPLPAARGLLARFVPGRVARSRARQADKFDAAAREALDSALKLEAVAPLAPAPPAARSAAAPTASLPAAAKAAASATEPVSLPSAPTTTPTTARVSRPTTPDTAPAAAPEPEAAARASAWATPPRLPEEQSAAPRGERPEELPGRPRRRKPGETAPDFLLRTPTSVARVADDFFDGLIRRVEGDRYDFEPVRAATPASQAAITVREAALETAVESTGRSEMTQPVSPVWTGDASVFVLERRVARTATRVIVLVSSIAALALGSSDLIKTAGLFGGFMMLALLAYRELQWPEADHLSRPAIALIAVLLALAWAVQLGLIPIPG